MKLLKWIFTAMAVTLMFLVIPVSAEETAAEGEAYATFEESTGTLTFKRTALGEAVPTAAEAGVDNVYTGFETATNYGTSQIWWTRESRQIKTIKSETQIHPLKMFYWFDDCQNLIDISGLSQFEVSQVTDINSLFQGCNKLTDLSPVAGWDVSNVTNMCRLFRNCSSLTDLTPLQTWSTDKVVWMESMFDGCQKLANIKLYPQMWTHLFLFSWSIDSEKTRPTFVDT